MPLALHKLALAEYVAAGIIPLKALPHVARAPPGHFLLQIAPASLSVLSDLQTLSAAKANALLAMQAPMLPVRD